MLTKVEIAKKTGLSRIAVTNILNNKQKNPRLESLKKIALAKDCSLEELIKEIEITNKKMESKNEIQC